MNRLLLSSALLLGVTTTFAAPPPAPVAAPRYGSGINPLAPVLKLSDAQLTQQIIGLAKQVKLASIDRTGKATTSLWKDGDAALTGASRIETIAVLAHLQRAGSQGAESDFLIAQPDGTRVPTTIIWELSGAMTVQTGAPVKDLLTAGPTAEEIAAKYKLDPFTSDGAPWTPLELATIDKALSLLTPAELALAGGLGFRRKGNDIGGRMAFYRRADDGMTIDVFNKVYSRDEDYFYGPVDAPTVASVSTILHELAHAMSDFQGRQKAIAANKAVAEAMAAQAAMKADPSPETKKVAKEKFAVADALRSTINNLDKVMLKNGRAAERAFAAVVDPAVSVTQYGRATIDENLAEGFVLSKLDEPALERVAKPAIAWYKAGTFATEAQKPLN
ncbi:MAG: hypothetical protein Q8L48_40085 [Archangium sp.]|nr:hypothetical protein [Archangium sp.]